VASSGRIFNSTEIVIRQIIVTKTTTFDILLEFVHRRHEKIMAHCCLVQLQCLTFICSAAPDTQSDQHGLFLSSDRQISSSFLGCTSWDFLDSRTASPSTIRCLQTDSVQLYNCPTRRTQVYNIIRHSP